MSEKVETVIALKKHQFDYLSRMAETHGLPDASKAIRCLIDYAMEDAAREQELFGVVRCRDC